MLNTPPHSLSRACTTHWRTHSHSQVRAQVEREWREREGERERGGGGERETGRVRVSVRERDPEGAPLGVGARPQEVLVKDLGRTTSMRTGASRLRGASRHKTHTTLSPFVICTYTSTSYLSTYLYLYLYLCHHLRVHAHTHARTHAHTHAHTPSQPYAHTIQTHCATKAGPPGPTTNYSDVSISTI